MGIAGTMDSAKSFRDLPGLVLVDTGARISKTKIGAAGSIESCRFADERQVFGVAA